MKYDFNTVLDRHKNDSIAYDTETSGFFPPFELKPGFRKIPMWVADMNFQTAPSVVNQIQHRLQHPLFGYFSPSEEYYHCIMQWHQKRHGCQIEKDAIGYEASVLGGLITALKVLQPQGGKVLLHSPAYIGFLNSLKNNSIEPVFSPLKIDENGIWRMDLKDMEEKIVEHHLSVMVFCSPHNPSGRVWEKEELEQMMELMRKYDVKVIVDEIWSDLIRQDQVHIPLQTISSDARNRSVALYSITKTFNLAGIGGAYHIVYNKEIRDAMRQYAMATNYNHMSVLGMHATIGAYSESGEDWLEELKEVLDQNMEYACEFVKEHLPGVHCIKSQGTYILLLDCAEYCRQHNTTIDAILEKAYSYGVLFQDARPFQYEQGIRVNLASPHHLVQEAFSRLKEYIF